MSEKPTGRRRADVKINVLESMELRSRRSIREAERKRSKRQTKRAEKIAKRDAAKRALATASITTAKANAARAAAGVITAKAKVRLSRRQGVKRAVTMIVTAGVIASASLPAYAFNPLLSAMVGFTGNGTDSNANAQSLIIAEQATQQFERGGFGAITASDLQNLSTNNSYRRYNGLTAADLYQNPAYSIITPADVINVAQKYVGVPYVLGGELPVGFDCSGLTRYVYAQFGVLLPHSVIAQSHDVHVHRIPRSEAQPGDLVILNNLSHEGIYAGGGQFYHAPRPGDQVKLAPIFTDSYFIARVTK